MNFNFLCSLALLPIIAQIVDGSAAHLLNSGNFITGFSRSPRDGRAGYLKDREAEMHSVDAAVLFL